MTAPAPTPQPPPTSSGAVPSPSRPADAAGGALFDALVTEHAAIYGYGFVSAHSTPDLNALVSASIAEHRQRREETITMLRARSVDAPLPAAGYQLPIEVRTPTDAANLAVRMEQDAAVGWRAVLEQSGEEKERTVAVAALAQCAVRAARWRRVLGVSPSTVAFPGGSE